MVGFVGRDGRVSARREGRRGNSYVGISVIIIAGYPPEADLSAYNTEVLAYGRLY